ncbi:hypothetical protein WICPIJ_006378 [Wickerhamomyces pijperi]|uniref:F-box domain-containing protein n=1 Tax=Wickerhamomyces pijperi TaxID=599730 RepID=A0A9P8Q1W0_WICPI|nr:hypothetical protein WICPIJ_006378 [Wickerhamomyces pijperi]
MKNSSEIIPLQPPESNTQLPSEIIGDILDLMPLSQRIKLCQTVPELKNFSSRGYVIIHQDLVRMHPVMDNKRISNNVHYVRLDESFDDLDPSVTIDKERVAKQIQNIITKLRSSGCRHVTIEIRVVMDCYSVYDSMDVYGVLAPLFKDISHNVEILKYNSDIRDLSKTKDFKFGLLELNVENKFRYDVDLQMTVIDCQEVLFELEHDNQHNHQGRLYRGCMFLQDNVLGCDISEVNKTKFEHICDIERSNLTSIDVLLINDDRTTCGIFKNGWSQNQLSFKSLFETNPYELRVSQTSSFDWDDYYWSETESDSESEAGSDCDSGSNAPDSGDEEKEAAKGSNPRSVMEELLRIGGPMHLLDEDPDHFQQCKILLRCYEEVFPEEASPVPEAERPKIKLSKLSKEEIIELLVRLKEAACRELYLKYLSKYLKMLMADIDDHDIADTMFDFYEALDEFEDEDLTDPINGEYCDLLMQLRERQSRIKPTLETLKFLSRSQDQDQDEEQISFLEKLELFQRCAKFHIQGFSDPCAEIYDEVKNVEEHPSDQYEMTKTQSLIMDRMMYALIKRHRLKRPPSVTRIRVLHDYKTNRGNELLDQDDGDYIGLLDTEKVQRLIRKSQKLFLRMNNDIRGS